MNRKQGKKQTKRPVGGETKQNQPKKRKEELSVAGKHSAASMKETEADGKTKQTGRDKTSKEEQERKRRGRPKKAETSSRRTGPPRTYSEQLRKNSAQVPYPEALKDDKDQNKSEAATPSEEVVHKATATCARVAKGEEESVGQSSRELLSNLTGLETNRERDSRRNNDRNWILLDISSSGEEDEAPGFDSFLSTVADICSGEQRHLDSLVFPEPEKCDEDPMQEEESLKLQLQEKSAVLTLSYSTQRELLENIESLEKTAADLEEKYATNSGNLSQVLAIGRKIQQYLDAAQERLRDQQNSLDQLNQASLQTELSLRCKQFDSVKLQISGSPEEDCKEMASEIAQLKIKLHSRKKEIEQLKLHAAEEASLQQKLQGDKEAFESVNSSFVKDMNETESRLTSLRGKIKEAKSDLMIVLKQRISLMKEMSLLRCSLEKIRVDRVLERPDYVQVLMEELNTLERQQKRTDPRTNLVDAPTSTEDFEVTSCPAPEFESRMKFKEAADSVQERVGRNSTAVSAEPESPTSHDNAPGTVPASSLDVGMEIKLQADSFVSSKSSSNPTASDESGLVCSLPTISNIQSRPVSVPGTSSSEQLSSVPDAEKMTQTSEVTITEPKTESQPVKSQKVVVNMTQEDGQAPCGNDYELGDSVLRDGNYTATPVFLNETPPSALAQIAQFPGGRGQLLSQGNCLKGLSTGPAEPAEFIRAERGKAEITAKLKNPSEVCSDSDVVSGDARFDKSTSSQNGIQSEPTSILASSVCPPAQENTNALNPPAATTGVRFEQPVTLRLPVNVIRVSTPSHNTVSPGSNFVRIRVNPDGSGTVLEISRSLQSPILNTTQLPTGINATPANPSTFTTASLRPRGLALRLPSSNAVAGTLTSTVQARPQAQNVRPQMTRPRKNEK